MEATRNLLYRIITWNDIMKLIIDSREPKTYKNKIRIWFAKIGVDCEIKELRQGDYQYGKTVIERKEILDFQGSVYSGRLKKQQYKLLQQQANEQTHPYIILQGPYRKLQQAGKSIPKMHVMTQEQFYGAISSLEEHGISVIRTDTAGIQEFCICLEKLVRHYNNEKPIVIEPILKSHTMDWDTQAIYNIKGIGKDTAHHITNKISIYELLTLPKKNCITILTSIDGIGKKTAERIINEVRSNIDG